jgi:hypothetical protein
MTTPTSDEPVERALRGLLAERRPADGAPDRLRQRVERLPELVGTAPRFGSIRSLGGVLAAAASLAVAALLVALLLSGRGVQPAVHGVGAVPSPGTTFDPTIDGPGIVDYVAPTLPYGALAIGVISTVLAVVFLIRFRRRRRIVDVVGGVVLTIAGVSAIALSFHPGFVFGDQWGPRLGYGVQVTAAPGSDGPDTWYDTAAPGQPIEIEFTIRNPGPLPIRLLGVVQDPYAKQMVIYRWSALWLGGDPYDGRTEIGDPQPFEPVDVQPNGYLRVYLVGKVGKCAYGPSFSLANTSDVGGFASRGRQIHFAFSVLGLASGGDVTLPVALAEPTVNGCTGSEEPQLSPGNSP